MNNQDRAGNHASTIKLISLNIWYGKLFKALMNFIETLATRTDIFCFQEILFGTNAKIGTYGIRENIYQEIASALPDFIGYPAPTASGFIIKRASIPKTLSGGLAIFARTELKTSGNSVLRIAEKENPRVRVNPMTGSSQSIKFSKNGATFMIGNLHGLWQVGSKGDTPERIRQSENILRFLKKSHSSKTVVIGDFNLDPSAACIKALEHPLRNLNREYDITITRNHYYRDMEKFKDYVSDYAFVSPDVSVRSFEVLPDEVSDHLALSLEFC